MNNKKNKKNEKRDFLELCKLYGYEVRKNTKYPRIITNEGIFDLDDEGIDILLKTIFTEMICEDEFITNKESEELYE